MHTIKVIAVGCVVLAVCLVLVAGMRLELNVGSLRAFLFCGTRRVD